MHIMNTTIRYRPFFSHYHIFYFQNKEEQRQKKTKKKHLAMKLSSDSQIPVLIILCYIYWIYRKSNRNWDKRSGKLIIRTGLRWTYRSLCCYGILWVWTEHHSTHGEDRPITPIHGEDWHTTPGGYKMAVTFSPEHKAASCRNYAAEWLLCPGFTAWCQVYVYSYSWL